MNYDEHIESWFDGLVKTENSEKWHPIITLSKTIPNRRQLEKMIELFSLLPAQFSRKLKRQARAIIRGDFRNEFRFRYSRTHKNSSTTSCFFSFIYQALTYPRRRRLLKETRWRNLGGILEHIAMTIVRTHCKN
jgi:hypothetical protein